MPRNNEEEHASGETADHGFKFQEEILFYLCLQTYYLRCENFSFGFEVKEIDKLDDTIIDCEVNGKKFAFFLQAKHSATKNQVFLNNFFSPTKEGGSKKFWKKYNLRQFVEALMSAKIQKSLEKYENHIQRYVIVTNNSLKTDNVETIVEKCSEFKDVFKKFIENGSEIVKFGEAFKSQMQEIINCVRKTKNEKDLYVLDPSYLLERIVVLSNVPSYEKLEGLSDKFVKLIFHNNKSDLLPKFLRQNVIDFIKPINNKRKFITRKNFIGIIETAMQEVELRSMTESFFQSLQFPVNFDKSILEKFRHELDEKKIIEFEGNDILSVLKVYDALKSSEVKVFLLRLSMLKKSYETYFRLPKSKILIYVDSAKNWKEMLQYENVIVIGGKGKVGEQAISIKKPAFEEFDEDTRKIFFRKRINLQGESVQLFLINSIITTIDENYVNFINDLMEELITKDCINFGEKLAVEAKFYIMRYFYDNTDNTQSKEALHDADLLKILYMRNIIIDADPGVGKTSTVVRLATALKKENPHYWVRVLFLTELTKIFHELKSTKAIDIENCVLNLLTFGQPNQEVCKTLLKIYMKQQKSVPIFIFFDGFDEIYPHYSDIVVKLITKLNELNIRTVVTTRSHCLANLESVENISIMQMDLFQAFQRNIFIRRYIEMQYPEDEIEETLIQIDKHILSSDVFDDKFLGTPILLRMIIDIFKKFPDFVLKLSKLNIFKIYNEIFEISFNSYYAKERLEPTLNVVTSRRSLEMKKIKEVYSFLAIAILQPGEKIPHDEVEYDVTEIISRGFVTVSARGELKFIHRTFAEYFVGEAIVKEITKQNHALIRFITEKWQEQIAQFAYLSLLDKMQKKSLEFHDVGTPQKLRSVFKRIFFNRQNSSPHEFGIVIEYIEHKTSREEFLDFLSYQFDSWNKLTGDHIDFLEMFLDERFGPTLTNSVLMKLESKSFSDILYFHTRFQNLLIRRNILSESESFDRIYTDFGAQYRKDVEINLSNISAYFKENTNYSKEIHFAVFENRKTTIESEVKIKIQRKYEKIDNFEKQDVVLMNYLILYLEQPDNMLEDLLTFFHKRQILLHFFEKLSDISICFDSRHIDKLRDFKLKDYEIFARKCIRIFMDNNWVYEKFDGKSLLFYCWSKNTMAMSIFLDHLPMQVIFELAASPSFNGKSAIEYYQTEEEVNFPLNYLEYLYKNSQKEDLFQCIVPFRRDHINIKAYCKNINLHYMLFSSKRNNVIDEHFYESMIEKLIEEIVKEVEEIQPNLLHLFACNSEYIDLDQAFVEEFFNELENRSYFMEAFGGRRNCLVNWLMIVDDNGDNLFHIAAKRNNNFFMEYIIPKLTSEELTDLLKMTNTNGQNYFHCLCNTYHIWEYKVCIPENDLEEIFLRQDVNGKTPFHTPSADFFVTFGPMLSDDALIRLFNLRDVDENNIFHHIARDYQASEDSGMAELRMFCTLNLSPKVKAEAHKACLEKNSEELTPNDLDIKLTI